MYTKFGYRKLVFCKGIVIAVQCKEGNKLCYEKLKIESEKGIIET